jgi:hypothetical protein
VPQNNDALQDEDERCPHPHRFSDAWSMFKLDVVDKSTKALSPGEVAWVKFPYAAGYAAAISVVLHLLDVSGDPRAGWLLHLLAQDAALSLRNAETALPPMAEAVEATVAASGGHFH